MRDKLRDELGPVIVSLLDRSSGLEDIIVNEDSRIWVKRTGSAFEQVGELKMEQARGAMMTIASMQKTTVTETRPVLETQLPIWRFRFAGLIEPVVPSPSFAIRIKPDRKRSLVDLENQGVLSRRDDPRNRRASQEDFLAEVSNLGHREVIQKAILARKNMLVVGGTGAGKTTIANAILEEIGVLTPGDRVLVIEDTQELILDSANSLSMLATTEFDQLKCLKVALRLKPDRIVVGEVRDGAAALPLLKSWNTGHPGGLSTLHANSAAEALVRLEDLVREATEAPQQRMIGAAVDIVIAVVNDPIEGRKVREIAVVSGYDNNRYSVTHV
ncbi:Conjugative transfer protein TrbB (plasmid) [Acidisarcina polymorpha]|uniref:Conjugative transfer protein TrbB n=1 Tax=Acidisarcina polymorpha TaxID=2211140 RepID=A0A2Z5GB45_9BACT|nr:Conjugative transfer protein TrbB [Acidisarcina polymorpha]